MMRRILFISILFWPLVACADHLEWRGSYIYEADFGENAAEQSILVEYTLEVGENSCKLSIQGYQVSEIILCRADVRKHSLEIKFQSYDDGSLKNQYNIQLYTEGQVLFHVISEKKLITHWGAMVPDESVAKPGEYFFKTAQ